MKLALVLVAVGGVASAGGYHMGPAKVDNPPKACRGDMVWQELLGLMAQAPLPKAGSLEGPETSKDEVNLKFSTADYYLSLRFNTALADDLDFKSVKAGVEARAKKAGYPLKWTRADKTADGYALVWSETTDPKDKKAGTDYNVLYLRTIGSTKLVCWNNTSVSPDASKCAAFVCEQIKPN